MYLWILLYDKAIYPCPSVFICVYLWFRKMNELLIGTKNLGKLKEIKSILPKSLKIKLISLQNIKNAPEIKETGKTYQANALKKAFTLFKITKMSVLAEDSGLEVKALGNRPGIYSARYSGFGANPEKNNQKLLKELAGIPLSKRTARYRCVAVLIMPSTLRTVSPQSESAKDEGRKTRGEITITEGICKGKIALEPSGKKGFGYDPLFIPDGYRKTFGQLSQEIKNRISHRTQAIQKLIPPIQKYFL